MDRIIIMSVMGVFIILLTGHVRLVAVQKISPDVRYEPTPVEVVRGMLDMAGVTGKDVVYDLGCGDGRIVIAAARERGARGVGVDIDPERIRESQENAKRAQVDTRVTFIQQDLFETNISEATVVMLFLLPEVNLELRPKLFRELRPGTRIVSHYHDMDDWKYDRFARIGGRSLYYWVMPAPVNGIWESSLPGGSGYAESMRITLRQQFQELSGSAAVGGEELPIKDAELRGRKLRFIIDTEKKGMPVQFEFAGSVSGNIIEGEVTVGDREYVWKAMRLNTGERS